MHGFAISKLRGAGIAKARLSTLLGVIIGSVLTTVVFARDVKPSEHLLARIKGECHQALLRTVGPAGIRKRMPRCVMDKLGETWSPPKKLDLVEYKPWLIHNRGPSASKGVIYYLLGWDGNSVSDQFHFVPYFVTRLNEDGWDIIGAKFPDTFEFYRNPRLTELASIAVPGVRQKLTDLRREGYRTVVLAGHSWGGWVAMQPGLGQLDAKVLLSPANVVSSTPTLANGSANPYFDVYQKRFESGLRNIKEPAVLVLMANDKLSPELQSKFAEEHFTRSGVAHLFLNRPAGFVGHYSGYLPVFDFAYGGCIQAFLDNLKNGGCTPPHLSNDDFRAIVDIKQLAPERQPMGSLDQLADAKLVGYGLGRKSQYIHIVKADEVEIQAADRKFTKRLTSRDGNICIGEECSRFFRWDERHFLEFDAASGALKYWWIRDN